MTFMNWFINTFLRSKPLKRHYTDADISRKQNELNEMRAAHQRLIRCDEDVLAECRAENPTVTSEIHIRDLVTFKASRLMQEIKLKEVNLNDAIYNLNTTR